MWGGGCNQYNQTLLLCLFDFSYNKKNKLYRNVMTLLYLFLYSRIFLCSNGNKQTSDLDKRKLCNRKRSDNKPVVTYMHANDTYSHQKRSLEETTLTFIFFLSIVLCEKHFKI